jgi:phosphatidylinositol glycan class N
MVVIGVLYLIFEDFVLADFSQPTAAQPRKHVARTLVGIQIGLTVLAMIITRSSALSIQARKGLSPGNQIVGWVVLGKFLRHYMMRWPY